MRVETERIKERIKDNIDEIKKTYSGLSQDYQDGVDEGLKVAFWIIKEVMEK